MMRFTMADRKCLYTSGQFNGRHVPVLYESDHILLRRPRRRCGQGKVTKITGEMSLDRHSRIASPVAPKIGELPVPYESPHGTARGGGAGPVCIPTHVGKHSLESTFPDAHLPRDGGD